TTVTLLGLLMATSAAFAITEHLKLIKSDVFGTEVSKVLAPGCHCATSKAIVRIRLRHTGHVSVTIVDSAGHKVATIANDVLVHARSPQHFPWYGQTDAGGRAPDGVYYPSVQLPRQTLQFRNKIVLDTKAPTVLSASIRKPLLFAAPGHTVAIRYAFSEPAHAVVYLGNHPGSHPIIVGHRTRPQGKVKWAGTLAGAGIRPGRYVLSVGARDVAGNETPASARKHVTVVVRYVQLSPQRLTVRSGRLLVVHVQTSARRYTWRLGHRHGAHRGKVLRLRAPTTPGTYRLVVAENGHATTAVVQVRAK
ncbi:MAG: hypothetical protein ACRDL7_08550, partial [Gaiellaceae bacterium]